MRFLLTPFCLLCLAIAGCRTNERASAEEISARFGRPGDPVHLLRPQEAAVKSDFWSQIANARVIYVPEEHGNERHHEAQIRVLQGLVTHKIRFAVGWEMFERPSQPDLTAWENGKISTDRFLKSLDWEKSWGALSPSYRNILEWTRAEGISNIALNAPREFTKLLAAGETLPTTAKPPSGFRVPEGALENFAAQMKGHPGMSSEKLSRYFAAQSLWDQTMAESIVDFLNRHPDKKIVVLLGRNHASGAFGVPAYVRQKTRAKQRILDPGQSPPPPPPSPALAPVRIPPRQSTETST